MVYPRVDDKNETAKSLTLTNTAFDAEFWKPLVLIHPFIINMKM